MIQVEVFWVVTSCGVEVGYQCFGEPCCLHFRSRENVKYRILYDVLISRPRKARRFKIQLHKLRCVLCHPWSNLLYALAFRPTSLSLSLSIGLLRRYREG
jgi:hypothetical protein